MDYSAPKVCLSLFQGERSCVLPFYVEPNKTHVCSEQEGHEGNHECACGVTWSHDKVTC